MIAWFVTSWYSQMYCAPLISTDALNHNTPPCLNPQFCYSFYCVQRINCFVITHLMQLNKKCVYIVCHLILMLLVIVMSAVVP